MNLPFVRFSSSSAASRSRRPFFTPSYLNRSSSLKPTLSPSSSSSRQFSFDSNGSRGRQGAGSASGPPAGRIPSPSPSPSPSSSTSTSSASSSSSSPTSTATSTAAVSTIAAPAVTEKKLIPMAPSIPHVSNEVLAVDSFFALNRPLLELPIRLPARRSAAPPAKLWASSDENEAPVQSVVEPSEILRAANGEELVEVVDLDAEGKPIGPSYITTLSAASASERSGEEAADRLELEAEAAKVEEINENGEDKFETFLIGLHPTEPKPSPAVSEYLATHPPFSTPPPPSIPSPPSPSSYAQRSPPPSSSSSHIKLSPKALSDLSFLRPFGSVPFSTSSSISAALSPETAALSPESTSSSSAAPFPSAEDIEIFSLTGGFMGSESRELSTQFLDNALAKHKYQAHVDFARHAGENLVLAGHFWASPEKDSTGRQSWEAKHGGGVKYWTEEAGWETVNFGATTTKMVEKSPFVPAERMNKAKTMDLAQIIDLAEKNGKVEVGQMDDFVEIIGLEGVEWENDVGMDSTRRKRKKKMAKHKFKKRRKAQKALRQRLGK